MHTETPIHMCEDMCVRGTPPEIVRSAHDLAAIVLFSDDFVRFSDHFGQIVRRPFFQARRPETTAAAPPSPCLIRSPC